MRVSGIYRQAFLAGLAIVLFASESVAQGVIHVDRRATGANTGSSWRDAFVSLQDALATVQSGDEVWLAAGTYHPDDGAAVEFGDYDTSFVVPGGVSLYGGFGGTETERRERDYTMHQTVLSGDLLDNDAGELNPENPLLMDNSRHVVRSHETTEKSQLDGLTITGGYGYEVPFFASGTAVDASGGSLHLVHCVVTKNVAWSGPILNVGGHLKVIDTRIENNLAWHGGGISVNEGELVLEGVEFQNNRASQGGALYVIEGKVSILESVFSNNMAFAAASAMAVRLDSDLQIWNSRFVGNNGPNSTWGTVLIRDTEAQVVNSIFTGNSVGFYGGALRIDGSSGVAIVNSVFAHNSAGRSGGALSSQDNAIVDISNSIFWQNTAPEGEDLLAEGQQLVSVDHSMFDIDFPATATDSGENIVADPLFQDADGVDEVPGTMDDDFRPTLGSPAIDSGSNEALVVDVLDVDGDGNTFEPMPSDIAGNQRVYASNGATVVDRGPFEFGAPPVGTGTEWVPHRLVEMTATFSIYPNPATTFFVIEWEESRGRDVTLELFDALGRRIRTIYHGNMSRAERREVSLHGISQGVYFIRETSTSIARKLAVLE